MGGAYLVQNPGLTNPEGLAKLLAGQLAHGGETVNHYALANSTLLGLVSQDKFNQGPMPKYLRDQGLWGILEGELHRCDVVDRLRKDNPHSNDLELFARLHRAGTLAEQLPHMNGAFFVILWDPADDTIIAANDRYGLYPMYWSQRDRRFCLAGRVLCSVLADVTYGDWNIAGAAQLLTLDDFLDEDTLLDGVNAFPQATVLTKRGESLNWKQYWHYDYTPDGDRDFHDLAEAVGDRIVEAVRRQCEGHQRVGVTLSGGLDSRCLVAAATRVGVPVQTFTWGKADAYDRLFAKDVAGRYKTQHHDCDYAVDCFTSRYEEGIRVAEGLNNFFDCHMLAHLHILGEYADLVLNGYAGDLTLGGSYVRRAWLQSMPDVDLAEELFAWRNTLVPEAHLTSAIPEFQRLDTDRHPSARYRQLIDALPSMATADLVDRFFLENRVRRQTSMGTVLMRCAVESAACFFDYDLMDLTTRIPAKWRHEHRIYKAMMARSFPKALRVRWQRTLLPASAPTWADTGAKACLKLLRIIEARIGRPRVGSRQTPVDFDKLLRGPWRAWMGSIIGEQHPTADQVLLPEFCERVWKEHLAGQDRTRILGAIAAIRGFSRALDRACVKRPALDTTPTAIHA